MVIKVRQRSKPVVLPVTSMTAYHIVAVVLLCFICCEAWVLKRQMSSDCRSRPAPCVQNGLVILDLFMGNRFESLVDNHDQFALQCSPEVRENTETCIQSNFDCTVHMEVTRLVAAYGYMCDNEQGFVNASSCWKNSNIVDVVIGCQDDPGYFSLPECLRSGIVSIPGCTPRAAGLFANIIRAALQRDGMQCTGNCKQRKTLGRIFEMVLELTKYFTD